MLIIIINYLRLYFSLPSVSSATTEIVLVRDRKGIRWCRSFLIYSAHICRGLVIFADCCSRLVPPPSSSVSV